MVRYSIINSKLSFRAAEQKYSTLLMLWSWLVCHFLGAFVSIVFRLNAGAFLLLLFLSGHNKSNFSIKSLKHGVNGQKGLKKSGPQQNPACPSANLLSNKHSSHFLLLSLEPLASCCTTNLGGCSTGVVTCAIFTLFHNVGKHAVFSSVSNGLYNTVYAVFLNLLSEVTD